MFISSVLKVPPVQNDPLYKSICTFTLPASLLNKSIRFFIAGRDDSIQAFHGMPNAIVGHTDVVDDTIKKLY